MKRLITVFILALITFSVNAQNEGEITGVIKDKISKCQVIIKYDKALLRF